MHQALKIWAYLRIDLDGGRYGNLSRECSLTIGNYSSIHQIQDTLSLVWAPSLLTVFHGDWWHCCMNMGCSPYLHLVCHLDSCLWSERLYCMLFFIQFEPVSDDISSFFSVLK